MAKRRWVGAMAAAVLMLGSTVGAVAAEDPKDALFERVRSVYDVVEGWHKDGADLEKFAAGAIKGGLEALGDPYTSYYAPDEFNGFLDSLNGNFSGIGTYLEQRDNYVVVSSPIKGSPAAEAGLSSGDRILEVNGQSMVGKSTDAAVQAIRGEAGTPVELKIERPAENRTFTLTITRSEIHIPEVEYKMLDNKVGYIQLASFGDDAIGDFYEAVGALKIKGAKGLVLDLRQNGGGYVQAAVEIASAWVPKDEPVVWQQEKEGLTVHPSSGRLIEMPVAVLVDGGSASASEILAGAIQDYGAGPLVGETTFGKGTVQQILYMKAGGGMKVTVAEYLTPKKRHVHEIGLTPDYKVENPKPEAERVAPLDVDRALLPSTAGLDVLYLQYKLTDLGYKTETRGFFGMNTVEAVAKFRKDNGLSAEALVDEAFVSKLNEQVTLHWKNAQQEDDQLKRAWEVVLETISK